MFLTPKNFYFEAVSSKGFGGRLNVSEIQDLELILLQSEGARNEVFELKSGSDSLVLKQAIVYSENAYFGFNREVSYYKHIQNKGLDFLSESHKYLLMTKNGHEFSYTWLCGLLFGKWHFEEAADNLLKALGECMRNFYTSVEGFKGVAGIAEYDIVHNAFKNYYIFRDIDLLFNQRHTGYAQKSAVQHFLNRAEVQDFLLNKCTAVVLGRDIIHGDMHVRNILRKEGTDSPVVPGLHMIDFESLAVGDRVYDLITLISSIAAKLQLKFDSKPEIRLPQLRFFIREAVERFAEMAGEKKESVFEKYYYLLILFHLQKLTSSNIKNFGRHLDLILNLIRDNRGDWYLSNEALELHIQK